MHPLHDIVRVPLRETLAFLLLYGAVGLPFLWHNVGALDFVAASVMLAAALAALSAVDLRHYRLPNAMTLPLVALGLFVTSWSGAAELWWSVVSAGLGFALLAGVASAYRHLRGRAGLGLGDAKLLAASGAWLGAYALPTVLLCATGLALVSVLVAYWRGLRLSGATRLPFGPFLALGTWLVWLYGPL